MLETIIVSDVLFTLFTLVCIAASLGLLAIAVSDGDPVVLLVVGGMAVFVIVFAVLALIGVARGDPRPIAMALAWAMFLGVLL